MNGLTFNPRQQQGAALVIGLILLLVLTILAVSGVFTSTMELRMVGNTQLQERAFQAAEVAVEEAMANPLVNTGLPEVQLITPNPNSIDDDYSFTTQHVCTSQPPIGSGYGVGVVTTLHFQVAATGTAPGNALAEHVQNFFVLGPASNPTDC